MSASNHNIGNAGEFYVLAQLSQRGIIAGKTDDGQTLIDIIATDPVSLVTVNIQVKTRGRDGDGWLMSAKNEKAYQSLWYVLVQLNGTDLMPDFYVFHSNVVGPWIQRDHENWLLEPKRDGSAKKNTAMRRFRPTPEDLRVAKNNWQAMFPAACFTAPATSPPA